MAFANPLDIFSPDAYNKAATDQRAYLDRIAALTGQNISNTGQQGIAALTSAQNNALGAVGSGYGTAQNYIQQYLPQATSAITSGITGGTGALTGAQAPALGALYSGVNQATGAYGGLADLGARYTGYTGQTSQAQADALGLNGPEGIARSRAAFQTSPGFTFATDLGNRGIIQAANAAGIGPSGNTLRASGEYVTNAANKEWDNYLANLQARQGLYAPLAGSTTGAAATGVANAALTGGTSGANIYTGTGKSLADIIYGGGTNLANTYTGAGGSLADLAARGGLAQGNIYTTTGQSEADLLRQLTALQTGFTQNIATPYASTYGAQAAAEQQAAAAPWQLGIAALGAAAGGGVPKSMLPTGTVGGKALF